MNDQINKPNTYTSEFKESTVKLALDSDQPIAQTARNLGVNPNTFIPGSANTHNRKELLQERMNIIYDENKRLKKELTRVTQERDLLKKAQRTLRRISCEVRVDKTTQRQLFRDNAV